MIVAHALTEPTVDAATIGIDLIETVDEEIARVTESVVAGNVLNQMTELGRPESYSMGR